ncbi:MAG: hypothetical protein DRO87_07630 [Candidatus Thorarchaeota archaeon]|nr:MAG: hypothetical protein DRP09_11740 [Candidatus Thorarchaeota archaeon]RLI56813.1 MAG: hypothetical protein DRO87_07630 [Candidatus Thorarchaeota archaeon]
MRSTEPLMMTEEQEKSEAKRLPASAYLVGSLTQFAVGLHAPFLQTYLVDMQNYLYGVKNFAELGAFRSVGNVAPTLLQPLWGATSDRIGYRKYFVAFGTALGLFSVFLFLWAATPIDMIVLYGVQSVLFSIQIPTWLSLISGLMGEENRGNELGKMGLVTSVASLSATLTSGILAGMPAILPALRTAFGSLGPVILPTVEQWREVYYIPFYLTAIVGIAASLLSLTIRESKRKNDGPRKFPPMLKLLSQPGDFRRFSLISVFFSFAMSMAWPYFIVIQRDWLSFSILEIATASAIMTFSMMVFSIPLGRMSDRVGRKPMILLGRSFLFLVPIMYAFAWNAYVIFLANALAGFTVAASMNAITAYIYDISPEEERGTHVAVFNTFTGIVYLLGSFISGLMGQTILEIFGSEHLSVFVMMILSGILRFFASFLYLFIREPREYKSTIRLEIVSLVQRRRHDSDLA